MQYEAALREAREASLREKSWLQQLPRPARTSYTEHSIVLSVDRGAKSRMADFTSGKVCAACNGFIVCAQCCTKHLNLSSAAA